MTKLTTRWIDEAGRTHELETQQQPHERGERFAARHADNVQSIAPATNLGGGNAGGGANAEAVEALAARQAATDSRLVELSSRSAAQEAAIANAAGVLQHFTAGADSRLQALESAHVPGAVASLRDELAAVKAHVASLREAVLALSGVPAPPPTS